MRKGFTLMEILVVVTIIVVLAVTVLLILNPITLSQQAHDATRVSDMNTLNKAISLYYSDAMSSPSTMFMGTSSIIYVSVPDPTATSTNQCTGLNLPAAPSGYTYQCSASSTYLKVDGTGWIPINFNSYLSGKGGSPISKLPVDPVNTTSTNLYYTYETDGIGGYKVAAFFESAKYAPMMASDGGNDTNLYEKGSNLALASGRGLVGYWPFNEGSGSTAYDQSGNGNNGTLENSPAWSTGPAAGSGALSFNNSSTYIQLATNTPLLIASKTISFWADPAGIQTYNMVLSDGQANYYVTFSNHGANEMSASYSNGSNVQIENIIATPAGTVGAWANYAFVFNISGSNVIIQAYMNGKLMGTESNTTGYYTVPNNTFYIGAFSPDTFTFNGLLSDVRVYNYALSTAQLQEMYNVGQ